MTRKGLGWVVANVLGSVVATCLPTVPAHAQSTFTDAFTQGHVDGELRLYFFSRIYGDPDTPNARALSGALLLNARTGTFGGGFSLAASVASANAFGTQPNDVAKRDGTLMGLDNSLTALTQAYAQFQRGIFELRVGDQYLTTPWMEGSDVRMIPASYQAVAFRFTPLDGWQIQAIRSFGWKSRTSDSYHFDNLYYPSTFRGDTMYGNGGGLPDTARAARGTWALGTTYSIGGLKVQGWYYDFLRFARMRYVDGSYTFRTGTGFDPFVAVQYVGENGGGAHNILAANAVPLFGVAGNKVDNSTWGTDVGVNIPHGEIDASWNQIARHSGAIGDGALISPYTSGYGSEPLYTTSMIRGLVDQGPGHAWRLQATYRLLDDRLQLQAAYARYTTYLSGDSHDLYFDITYKLDGWLKGLSLRNRWERASGGIGLNPGNRAFTYNRLMIDYQF